MGKIRKPLIMLGDIHGDFNYVKWYIKNTKMKDCAIYQVGDFGIGFNDHKYDMDLLTDLDKFLKGYNIQFYAIRGNHDNPVYFDGYFRNYFSNLHLLADYDVIEVDGKKILGVGGAVSVDRVPRMETQIEYLKKGIDKSLYWKDEIFVLDEDKLKDIKNIDIVVTHTAPDFCSPVNKLGFSDLVNHYSLKDDKLKEDLLVERGLVTNMWRILMGNNKPDYWLYGHFHNNWMTDFEGTKYRLLNVSEYFQYPNIDDYKTE